MADVLLGSRHQGRSLLEDEKMADVLLDPLFVDETDGPAGQPRWPPLVAATGPEMPVWSRSAARGGLGTTGVAGGEAVAKHETGQTSDV
jgi:hypothetical protein